MTTPDLAKVQRALLSVSDKEGLVDFARFLAEQDVKLISTGGTAKALRDAGLEVTEVSEITGFPEIMDGRVKTLHPMVHGGLLARRDKASHIEAMAEHGIAGIDLLVVNLYPFRETLVSGADRETCVENIDIGGPAMVRAAAKNHASVTVVTSPGDYHGVGEEMSANAGATTMSLRRKLAAKAYAHTAAYDSAISSWMLAEEGETFPAEWSAAGALDAVLRYGENPHQQAAFYRHGKPRAGVATATQHQGKELSYNNLNDTDAAFELVAEFERPAVAIIKHANPCGVAEGESLAEAYEKALACDPNSAFGGIIAVNRPLDGPAARKMTEIFTEVVIAPEVSDEAKEVFAAKKNLRLLETGDLPDPAEPGLAFKAISGGILVQSRDNGRVEEHDLKVVTKRAPSAEELADMLFAFRVAKHVKSNAIVYVKGQATLGMGAGQMSRVDSSRIAAWKGRETFGDEILKGAVVASDAFFPFADGLLEAVKAGATAVIQPGGSMRDDEVIAAADEAGLAMVFTGMRHFRH